MEFRLGRIVVLVLAMVAIFGAVSVVMLQIIPAPRKETDYLVIGTLATFASLATLFVVVIASMAKDSNPFFFKRKKE